LFNRFRTQAYIDRVKANESGFCIIPIDKDSPWAIEERLSNEVGQIIQDRQNEIAKIIETHSTNFRAAYKSVGDRQRETLVQQMQLAAYLYIYKKMAEDSKFIRFDAICKAFDISTTNAYKYLQVYELIKCYNLILYSGASFASLHKWKQDITGYLWQNPEEALFFTGESLRNPATGTANYIINNFQWNLHSTNEHVNQLAREQLQKESATMDFDDAKQQPPQ